MDPQTSTETTPMETKPESSPDTKLFDNKLRDIRLSYEILTQTIESYKGSKYNDVLINLMRQVENDIDAATDFIEQKLK